MKTVKFTVEGKPYKTTVNTDDEALAKQMTYAKMIEHGYSINQLKRTLKFIEIDDVTPIKTNTIMDFLKNHTK